MKAKNNNEYRKKFKELFIEEFNDPNESFIDFMLDLIQEEQIKKILVVGKSYYYSQFEKYK